MNQQIPLQKRLLTDPDAVISDLQCELDDSAAITELTAQGESLQKLLVRRDALIEQRRARNAAVGRLKRAGQSIDQEVDGVRQLSADIDALESQIDEVVRRVASVADDAGAASEPPALPGQFRAVEIPAGEQSDVTIVSLDQATAEQRAAWDRYADGHPAATHYHQYAWRTLIEAQCGVECIYLMALDERGSTVGLLPAVMMRSRLFGAYLLSMPFLVYGGALADHESIRRRLADHLHGMAAGLGASRTELRETQPREGWRTSTGKVSMVLALPEDPAELNRQLGTKVRAQVKRAAREPVNFEIGGLELVRDFYRVFSEKMRDHGTPVYPRRFFDAILQQFPESVRIAAVRRNGRIVAAAVLVRYRDTMEVPWAAARRRYDATSVNMYLYHQVLELACREGCRCFDFGRSTRDATTYRFKRQWGAQPCQLYWHAQAAPGQQLSDDDGPGTVMSVAVSLWRHLPVPLANTLGPLISTRLPW